MKRILVSIMTVGVVAAMMGLGTFAYFNDVESAGFTISAGAIDLEVDGENPWCESFDFELKPSWDWEKNFTLHMTADSNPAKVCFTIKDIQNSNGFETEPELWAEGAVYNCTTHEWNRTNWHPICNLSDHIKVDMAIQSDEPGVWLWFVDDDGGGSFEWVAKPDTWDWSNNLDKLPTLSQLHNIGWVGLTGDAQSGLPEKFEPCHNYTFHLSLHNTLNGNDNEYQGDTTSFTIEFYATQTDNPNCGGEECYKNLLLPEDNVNMVVAHPGGNSYFDTTLSNVPNGYDVTNGTYVGWCCDEDHTINPGTVYSVHLYSSYDPNMPDYLKDPDWDMVNYILNHKQGTWQDVQDAIWYFIDHGNMPSSQAGKDMVNDALAHGEGFKPACGQIMAVICDAGENVQHTFIEVDP